MEQYSNLNVHGKITQKAAQGTANDDVVKYKTLTDRVPVDIPAPTASQDEGKALIVNQTGDGFEFGEAGKVDAVQINGTAIAGDGAQTKIANIPIASSSALGVVEINGGGLQINSTTGVVSHSNSVAAETSGKGSATAIPIIKYDAQGHITSVTTATVYPPTTAGTSGYVWKSDGSGVAQWSQLAGTAPITVTNTSATKTTITHDTSGPSSSADTSVDDASKTLTITVDKFGHTKTLTGKSIQITESQVTNLSTDLGNKVDKTTTASKIYATTSGSSVSQTTLSYGTSASNNYIVQRKSDGQITVLETPVADTDAASKKFVNSSIATNTATFRGTYNALSLAIPNTTTTQQKQAVIDTWASDDSDDQNLVAGLIAGVLPSGVSPENNDYVFIGVDQTPTGDAGEDWFWRFKYNGSAWVYEYTLNNSSYTQAQWDAINSGITSTKVSTYDNYPTTLANKLVVGATNSATANAAVASSTNSIFLNLTEGGSVASNSSHNIVGSGATKVASDANGKITISSTDQSVTASSYHYTPSTASGQDKTASASGATAAWSIDVVKGVTLNTDGKGHVTGLSVTSGKIPANPNTIGKNIIGASNSATADATTTNTTTFLNHVENGSAQSSHKISGSGGTSVAYDTTNGLVISSPTIPDVTVATTGSGNAVTAIAVDSTDKHKLNVTKGITAVTKTGSSTANQVVLWNGTDSVVKAANQSALTPGVSIATDSGTNALTMAHATKYKLTVGASTFIFTTPSDNNTDTLVKQTAQASTTTSYPLLASAQSSPTSGTAYEAKYSTSCYIKSNEVYSNGYATWNTNSLPFSVEDVPNITES